MCGYMGVYPFVCGERHISVSLYPLKSRINFSFFLKKGGSTSAGFDYDVSYLQDDSCPCLWNSLLFVF